MTPRSNVRGHTRRTASGGTTRVRQHARRGVVTPRHSWKLLRRAFRAGQRGRKAAAVAFGAAGILELVAWLSLSGIALILATFAIVAGAVAYSAAMAGGMPAPRPGHQPTATSGRARRESGTRQASAEPGSRRAPRQAARPDR